MKFNVEKMAKGYQNGGHNKSLGPVGSIIFCIVGIVIFIIAVYMRVNDTKLNKLYTGETTAICERYEEKIDLASSENKIKETYVYYPVFSYTVNDINYSEEYKSGSSIKEYDINEEITIRYNPSNPKEYKIANDKSDIILPYSMMAFGIFFAVLGIVEFKRLKNYENAPVEEHINESVTKIGESVENIAEEEHKVELPEK